MTRGISWHYEQDCCCQLYIPVSYVQVSQLHGDSTQGSPFALCHCCICWAFPAFSGFVFQASDWLSVTLRFEDDIVRQPAYAVGCGQDYFKNAVGVFARILIELEEEKEVRFHLYPHTVRVDKALNHRDW